MRLISLLILSRLCLPTSPSAVSGAEAMPQLRHTNYLALRPVAAGELRLGLVCIAHGYASYADWLDSRLILADGSTVAKCRAAPGTNVTLAAQVPGDALCALELSSGWNLGQATIPAGLPYAYRSRVDQPLKTVGPWGPLQFVVPAGTRKFQVFVQASVTSEGVHLAVLDPAGKAVREEDGDFDERTKLDIEVPAGAAGAAWALVLSKPLAKGMVLDDVYVELGPQLPPFLSPSSEYAKVFAAGWNPAPPAAKPGARPVVDAKLPPFHGVTGAGTDAAYSRETGGGWHTSLPFTYILDYGPAHLGNPEYIPTMAKAPPVLLHLGKDVPFNHGWGPVKALGGENQAYGTTEYIQRISPDQVRERIAGLQQMTAGLREAGVRWVMPYICGMTVNGDLERRTGFWEFYDHWDEYRAVGLGPRPAAGPAEWLQRTPDGQPRIYYSYDPRKEFYPPFKTNHRYAACWNTEGWQTWLSEVVRFVARCGYDGTFVDNGLSQRCQCQRCLAAFRAYLKRQYPPERARRAFGEKPLDEVVWPGKNPGLLGLEMSRFWSTTLRDEMATIKAAGTRELGREFIVFPNGGSASGIQRALADCDFVMFEKTSGDHGTHPGIVMSPVFEGLKVRLCNDNVFDFKFVQCLRQRVRTIILSSSGYPRSVPTQELNAATAALGMAECAAFSGGGGFLLRMKPAYYCDVLNQYREFIETHPELYAGLDSYAQVGVLACVEQDGLGNPAHLAAVRQLTTGLLEAHALFDYVPETQFRLDVLKRYPVVVAADLKVLSAEELHALAEYVRGRGLLVLLGEFAVKDELLVDYAVGANPDREFLLANCVGTPGGLGRCAAGIEQALAEVLSSRPGGLGVLTVPDATAAPYVRVNAFVPLSDQPTRVVVHIVNYNAQLGVDAPPPTPVTGVRLNLPFPAVLGKVERHLTVRSLAPGEGAPATLAAEVVDGRVRMAVPPTLTYRVVDVQLQTGKGGVGAEPKP